MTELSVANSLFTNLMTLSNKWQVCRSTTCKLQLVTPPNETKTFNPTAHRWADHPFFCVGLV